MITHSLIIYYFLGIIITIGVSLLSGFLLRKRNVPFLRTVFFSFGIGSIFLLIFDLLKYYSLHLYIDYAHWIQLLQNINLCGVPYNFSVDILLQKQFIPTTVSGLSQNLSEVNTLLDHFPKDPVNFLSIHFVPFLYVFSLFFKIFPFNETLIFLNYLFMSSAVIPLYKLAKTVNDKNKLFPLFVSVLLLWNPTFQYILMYEFEILRFSIPVCLWMIYFRENRKTPLFILTVVLSILVREEMGLTVIMFGLYILIFERKKIEGILVSLAGISGFLIITLCIMPLLRNGAYSHIASNYFAHLGSSYSEIIMNIIIHPINFLKLILEPAKSANVFMLFLPLLFIPLLSYRILFIILANILMLSISYSCYHVSYMLFYVSPSIPFIFYAFIKSWPGLVSFISEKFKNNNIFQIENALMISVFVCTISSNVFFGGSPLSLQFWFKNIKTAPLRTQSFHYTNYIVREPNRKIDDFIKMIPDSSVVSAQAFVHPRLFRKKMLMQFPQVYVFNYKTHADYVLLDKSNNRISSESVLFSPASYFRTVEKDPIHWELIKKDGPIYLYKYKGN